MHLFGEPEVREKTHINWRPDAPPELNCVDDIEIDFETDGLAWW